MNGDQADGDLQPTTQEPPIQGPNTDRPKRGLDDPRAVAREHCVDACRCFAAEEVCG